VDLQLALMFLGSVIALASVICALQPLPLSHRIRI
jgi:hypothetical protein